MIERRARSRWWLSVLSTGLSLVVLGILVTRVSDTATLIDRIPASTHLAVLMLVGFTLVARAWRLRALAAGSDARVSARTGARAHLFAEAWAAVTPARTGGDPARVWVLHKSGVPPANGAALVAGEVVGDLVVVVTGSFLIGLFAPSVRVLSWLTTGFSGAIGVTLVALSFGRPARRNAGVPRGLRLLRLSEAGWRRLRVQGRKFLRTLRRLRRAPIRTQITVVAFSLLNVVSRLAILPVLAWSLTEDVSLLRLVVWPMLLFYPGAALPLPAGGGLIEMGFASGLASDFGVEELSVVLLWWRFYTHHLLALAGGLLILLSSIRRGGPSARTVAPDPENSMSRHRHNGTRHVAIVGGLVALFATLMTDVSAQAPPAHAPDTRVSPSTERTGTLWTGERMEFGVQFGPVRLGKSHLVVGPAETVDATPAFRVDFAFEAGIPFYRIHDRQVSWIAMDPLRSLRFDRHIREGRKRSDVRYHLNREDELTTELLTDTDSPPTVPAAMLPDAPLDDLALLFEVRGRIAAGENRFELDRYYLDRGVASFWVTGRERIRVPAGRFDAVVLRADVPGMSIFEPQARARIYIGAEAPYPILMVKTQTKHGELVMYLTDYEAGTSYALTH